MQLRPLANQAPATNRAARRRQKRDAKKNAGGNAGAPLQRVDALLQAAESLRQQGRLTEAESLCRETVRNHPQVSQAHSAMALILEQQDRRDEALEHFKQAVTLAPRHFESWLRLGRCLFTLKHYEAALIALKNAIALTPAHLGTLLFIGLTLQHLERHEEALAAFTAAVEHHPESADAHLKKGKQQQTLGDFSGARDSLNRAVELDPGLIEGHFHLSSLIEAPDELETAVAQLRELATIADLAPEKRASALFAAARMVQKQKRYSEAFELYGRANGALKEIARFDRGELSSFVDASIGAFTADVFETLNAASTGARAPVFIVGMPRSGTTLVEQIVSSHSQVGAGGEEQMMSTLVNALLQVTDGQLRYPTDLKRMAPEGLSSIGRQYLSHMRGRLPDFTRMTDKNPFNFFHVGLISILFPDASIIHCQRDPLDTCLSCYFQYFGEAGMLDFTTDLEDLGHFYNNYRRLMTHWDEVLPGRVLHVPYEDMIGDQEGMSRAVIDHLGLEWDDACLRFSENHRGVRTASQWQVRQPIYTSSVGRWRRYETELTPLLRVLEQAA